jgi:hypothetical protein
MDACGRTPPFHAETFIEMVVNHPTLGGTFKYAAYDALAPLGPA